MKAIVEWGRPKFATNRQVTGISAKHVEPNASQAAHLASQLYFQQVERSINKEQLLPTKEKPRQIVWSPDNSFWVAVSLLDGIARGDYAGVAYAEALMRQRAQPPLRSLAELYKLWDELADVPVTPSEQLDAPFLLFGPGVPLTEVWHWFERQNARFIVGDVMQGIRARDE
ncbi:hypothetical protein LMG26857_03445 [Achromobacter anxifer]|uniref:hypothetical protein n=1 Tax=Achromobacter anxifer TaxID=1287737 RepID=UPI00155BACAC|nr:hypothetical protein [Achromobacter anxifer]CAB5514386.1 hypothetical protein LMG26857_03445 [Achromobacter anxifer]